LKEEEEWTKFMYEDLMEIDELLKIEA